jgi:rhomboid protease GluP
MAVGFTPKHIEKYQLDKFTPQQFLILAINSARNLDWDLGFISETGFIAYLNKGLLEWNAQITFKIEGDSATIKSESLGGEMVDFGRNKENIEKFSQVFNSMKHLMDADELNEKYEELKPRLVLPKQDILSQPPATGINKFLEYFSIFLPRDGYFITPILIDINILIYILMVCSGVNFMLPDSESLLTWGANIRSLTMEGEWWRLITNCFLHIGIIHLLMNMYALIYIGLLLEPRIGKVKFIAAYFITGIIASIASIWWHDQIISAGASGAIFGMYGVFLALLLTNIIEKAARNALLTSIGIFVAYNLLNGMKGGIDNAAHIGGLISGLIIGFSFYLSLVKPESKTRNLMISSATLAGILLFSILTISHIPNTIGKYDKLMKEFIDTEHKAMSFYRISKPFTDETALKVIKDEGIPNWKECKNIADQIDYLENLPEVLISRTDLLKKYCDFRIESFELMAQSIERKTNSFKYRISMCNKKIDLIIEKLKGKEVADSLISPNPALDITPTSSKNVLYIVDDQPVDNVNNINPETVESVDVLKPAEAIQLYGKRGEAGAVLIQTKKGSHIIKNDSLINRHKNVNEEKGISYHLINIFDNDTLPKVLGYDSDKSITIDEKKAFKIVWSIKKLRMSAIELSKKGIPVYSAREEYDSSYRIAIYQLLPDHSHRMTTFRVSNNFKKVQECTFGSDVWKEINK